MKKIKLFLEAIVVVGIALAFVMPGAAMFVNEERVVFDNGPINKLLSREEGWIIQNSGFWDPSRGIRFLDAVNENVAWATGYDGTGGGVYETIFTRTTNGGDLWEADIIFMDEGYGFGNICGLDDGVTAWGAVFSTGAQDENCGIYKTTDGGDSWVHQFEGPYSFANNVWFFDENEGVALGDQLDDYFEIYTSDDGGETWDRVPKENFYGHQALPGEWGWTGVMEAVGDNTIIFGSHAPEGYAYISHDRGHTWYSEFTGCSGTGMNPGVNDLAFKDPDNGLAAHDNGESFDLYTTSDGGETWEEIIYSGFCYSAGLSYVPGTDNMYISVGAAEFYSGASYSLDGGYSWTDFTEMEDIQMMECDFVENGIGWAGSFNDIDDPSIEGMFKYIPPENQPPSAPKIDGPGRGSAGTSYEYTFTSTDPDDDQVSYYIKWGDGDESGWTALQASGEPGYTESHTWDKQDEYTITAKARDENGYEGPEAKYYVIMPRSRIISSSPFLKFIQQFPNLVPIMRLLLQQLGL